MSNLGIVLITGAAKRIGRAIAVFLAQNGWRIAIHCHQSQAEAQQLAQLICRDYNVDCTVIVDDLSTLTNGSRIIEKVEKDLGGPPNALINNASVFDYDAIETFNVNDWNRTWQVNVTAPVLLIQAMALSAIKKGVVINVLDQKIFNLNPDHFSYTHSKLALAEATHFLALTLASRGIRVNAVAPGITLPARGQSVSEFQRAQRIAALGQSNRLEDIAHAVAYLLAASSVTGQILTVDGGQHLIPMNRDVSFLVREHDE